jgi:hypothetical protein
MPASTRYPLFGGLTRWLAALLITAPSLVLAVHGDWEVAAYLALPGLAALTVLRGLTLEVSPHGLACGLVVNGVFVGPARVVPWAGVERIETRWCRGRDCTTLDAVVTGTAGEWVRFTSRMGLASFWGLVAEIVRRAPHARRAGLTEQVLVEAPRVVRGGAARTASLVSALGLLLVLALAAWI